MRSLPATKLQTATWRNVEFYFLIVFLFAQFWLLLRYAGIEFGYDVAGHLQNITTLEWLHPALPLRSFYYAHHPPTAFLIAKAINILEPNVLRSAQMTSFFAMLIAFFSVRSIIRLLGMLDHPAGIGFLYFAFGMPIHVYMSILIGIDPVMFLWTCLVLLFSLRLFLTNNHIYRDTILLTLILILAMLTKYSGVLLLSIPMCLAVFFRAKSTPPVLHILLLCITTVVIVFPYYFFRYYLQEGTFFFDSAGNHAWVEEVRAVREFYQGHPERFFPHLFLYREHHMPWLLTTWDGFWIGFDRPPQSQAALSIGQFYMRYMPLLLLLGSIIHWMLRRSLQNWRKFGAVLVLFIVVNVVALTYYIYTIPIELYHSTKSIYVSPVMLGLAFLISGIFELPNQIKRFQKTLYIALFGMLTLFVLTNHLLPVF